eukprot:Partr_v1_DN27058_c0_g1_i1_m28629 putative replication termination factor 2 domain containing 1
MGADGGSIPKRDELVKTKAKEEKIDRHSRHVALWYFCALSKRPLRQPIVACRLGRLYNKDAVYEFLLDRVGAFGDGEDICSHIHKIRDVVTLQLTVNPSFVDRAEDDEYVNSQFICPITMKEMNGSTKFSFLWTCGHVFSDAAIREIPQTSCIECSVEFTPESVITLNPGPEELVELRARIDSCHKKPKKRIAKRRNETDPDITASEKKKQHIELPQPIIHESPAIQSLYRSAGDSESSETSKGNWLTKGTFTRYARMG